MSNKIGGTTANGNVSGRPMHNRFKCKWCSRSYAQSWTKDKHEKRCRLKIKEIKEDEIW